MKATISEREIDSDNLTYEQVLDAWEKHDRISAKAFVGAACDALRRKHPLYTNKDIRQNISKDVRKRQLCTPHRLSDCWPDWVRMHADEKIPQARILEIQAETAHNQETIESYQQVDEQAEQMEDQEEPASYEGEGQIIEPLEPRMPLPIEVYTDTVRSAERLWSALVTTNAYSPKRLIPSQTSDPLLDFIKPSRKVWLRTLKGLSEEDANHMQMCLVWLDMLIQDRLQMSKEINKERKEIER